MERKKTREKMRRQEVNDRFTELMEALHEVDAQGSAAAAEAEGGSGGEGHGHSHSHLPGSQHHGLSCLAAGCDKGNFRVDVLSRAVRVLRVRFAWRGWNLEFWVGVVWSVLVFFSPPPRPRH
jgi:hypothetical protein